MTRRGRILLEDAFHTASLPEDHAGRLLLVRSLHLGKFSGRTNSASLSLLIEKRLAQSGLVAVHADTAADRSPVVYFRNEVEPYLCLALRIARQQPVNGWFWPLAIPEWKPSMSRPAALRCILFALLKTAAGPAAAATLLKMLQANRVLTPMLDALLPADGEALLCSSGWSFPMDALKPETRALSLGLPALPASWQIILRDWHQRWAHADARLAWLTAIVFLAENPARLLDHRLLERAWNYLAWLDNMQPKQNALAIPATKDSSSPADVMLPFRTASQTHDTAARKLPSSLTPDAPTTPPETRSFTACQDDKADVQAPPIELMAWDETPLWTKHAGLFLLLPVITRLGMTAWLEQHPTLIEDEFPARLLHHLAATFAIPMDDAVRKVLPLTHLAPKTSYPVFSLPPQWSPGLCSTGPLQLHRIAAMPRRRVLCDSSRRLVLASWQGTYPTELRQRLTQAVLQKGAPVAARDDLQLLLETWQTALRRWCHRFAQLNLSAIIRRPGRLVISKTHLELLFQHEQADIRIRRVGLDLNPGWVPWFGRVVTIHYQFGAP